MRVTDDGLRTFEHLVRDLHAVDAEFFVNFLSGRGLQIVERGQAVHEPALGAGVVHQLPVDLIRHEIVDALGPDLIRLAHGDPHVRVKHVGVLRRFHGVGDEFEHRAGLGGDGLTRLDQLRVGEVCFRRAGDKVHAHLCAADHEGVAHVVARVAQIHELDALELAEMLLNRQEIRQNLRRVELVRQPVPDAHAGVFRQILHDLLPIAAVLDAVKHAAEHARGVGDALLFADLRALRVEIDRVHTEIGRRHLEAAAGAGAGFFKNEGDVLALAEAVRDARLFLRLQISRKAEDFRNFRRREVQQREKVFAFERHIASSFFIPRTRP